MFQVLFRCSVGSKMSRCLVQGKSVKFGSARVRLVGGQGEMGASPRDRAELYAQGR